MPEGRRFKPGSRTMRKGDAEFGPDRWAWLKTNLGQLIIMVTPTEARDADIKVIHQHERGRSFMNLTGLTEPELMAFKEFINTSIDWALPIVQERDANAAAALAQGDDRYPRVYRPLPQLIWRKGHERAHWEELRRGPEGTADVVTTPGDPNGGLPQTGGEVPDGDASGDGTQDDGA